MPSPPLPASVCLTERRQLPVKLSHTLVLCCREPAGDSHSADGGSGGAAVALADLPADGGAARRPAGALLLAKGTTQTLQFAVKPAACT